MTAASADDEYRDLELAFRGIFPDAIVEVSPSQSRGHASVALADVHLARGSLHLRVELQNAASRAQLIDAVELARLPMGVREIASNVSSKDERIRLTPGYVSKVVGELERRGYFILAPSAEDLMPRIAEAFDVADVYIKEAAHGLAQPE
ncbi:MAG: hypothetical protein Q7U89_05800 [Coriobacteriia bacterium]|nr:hypothetical protein [Coriobacteriia bacterium]